MVEQKDNKLPDQPGSWFLNRGLFSDHFLKAQLPQWKEWQSEGELATFRKQLSSLYESTKMILPLSNEAQTEKEFVQPVLDLLGYANSYIVQAPTQIGEHTNRPDYALFPDQPSKNKAYEKLKNNDYTLCIGVADAKYWGRELDLAKSSDRDTFSNQNPSFQIASYLTGTKQTWGILTNGRLWRLYCAKSHLPLGNYYQVDLVQLLDRPDEALKYFYLFFRKAALIQVDDKSFLDHVLEESNQYAVELEADIKERAYEVVEVLCRGFAAGFPHDQLTEQTLKAIYDNSLTLLYRLLFVFYAEARELLPLTTNQSYRDKYSNHKLTQEIDDTLAKGYQLSSKSTGYYQRLSSLFKLISEGDPVLGVPEYNGGLFEPKEHPFLEEHTIADAFLVQAIQQLARIPDKKLGRVVAVDYNTLSERHLGNIYEGLLEFMPRVAPSDLVMIKDKGSTKYAPADKYPDKKIAYKKGELYLANDNGERKASGSYYTPEYIVNYIVENTLDPLTKEAHEKVKALKPEVDKSIAKWEKLREQKQGLEPTEKYDRKIAEERDILLEPYLSLKVLDPAMGSGHFLSRATDFLAEAIATDPFVKAPPELTEDSELTYYRRRVVESCIYGVDLNPLAVELAKLTLWLTTMAKSKPLSFLNHHLRTGNSLIGARVSELDEIPKAKRKKNKALDLSRAPVQLGLFQEALNKKLYDLLQNRALIAHLSSETLADIHQKQEWETAFQHNMERFRTLADVWVSTYFGNEVAWDEYNTLVENLQSTGTAWEKLAKKPPGQNARKSRDRYRFFHWELEFPEVFYDEKGNRKANPGFDAVVGNPPYVNVSNLDNEMRHYCQQCYRVCKNKSDLYAFFLEQEVGSLTRLEAYIGKILSGTWKALDSFQPLRKLIFDNCRISSIAELDMTVFPDAVVRPLILIAQRRENKKTKNDNQIDILDRTLASVGRISQEVIGANPDFVIDTEWIPAIGMLFHTFEDNAVRLQEIIQFTRGVKTSDDKRFVATAKSTPQHKPVIRGRDVERYAFRWSGEYLWYRPDLMREKVGSLPHSPSLFEVPEKLITQRVNSSGQLIVCYDDSQVYSLDTTNVSVLKNWNKLYSLKYLAALLNSKAIQFWYCYKFRMPTISGYELHQIPIHRVNFNTPQPERKRLKDYGQQLYLQARNDGDFHPLLAFVDARLPNRCNISSGLQPEQSDVVHDLLAFLAEEMIRLNKEKQSRIKAFLSWLEKEILKGSVEDQKNKTRIKDFHDNTFEDFLDVLKKNKAVPDPCPSNIRDTIAGEFSAAVSALTPLKAHVKATDNLIDRIVYRLYGLTDAEIAIVEGHDKTAQN